MECRRFVGETESFGDTVLMERESKRYDNCQVARRFDETKKQKKNRLFSGVCGRILFLV